MFKVSGNPRTNILKAVPADLNLLILTAAVNVLSQQENATMQNNLFPCCREHLEEGDQGCVAQLEAMLPPE